MKKEKSYSLLEYCDILIHKIIVTFERLQNFDIKSHRQHKIREN